MDAGNLNGAAPLEPGADNTDWQLAELVDAIAAEIDQAQDTLSLKSYARGLAFAVKTLSLDLEVKVRRAADGRLLFRTVNPDESSATVLKLDFAQVLQSQLQGVRKPLADGLAAAGLSAAALDTLDQLATEEELAALRSVGILALDDLARYSQTPAMMAELSRKTRLPEARLRQWRQLPFITAATPASGPPGSTVVIEGGNLGSQPGFVLFQQNDAKVLDWRDGRIAVEMPPDSSGPGLLLVQAGDQMSNTLSWEAATVDLAVQDIAISPAQPTEDDEIVLTASLRNQGALDAAAFAVQWTLDGQTPERLPHGPLLAHQRSQESTIRRKVKLSAGLHRITFTADPENKLPDVNRQNGLFSRQIEVRARRRLRMGDFRTIDQLDPLRNATQGPADVLRLLFRGLARLDPETGEARPDLAATWEMRPSNGSVRCLIRLPEGLYWHDGAPLTLDDVKFTYETILADAASPWRALANQFISEVRIVNRTEGALALVLKADAAGLLPETLPPALLTIAIVPQRRYAADPAAFGQQPIGSGPFQLAAFTPGQTIQLRAFTQYSYGKPRLDSLEIQSEPDAERLIQSLRDQSLTAAVLPYSAELAAELSAQSAWAVHAQGEPPALLDVTASQVHERFANAVDTNWNAHLWYV
ncbi:MAG: ABC transporter substrate-binding protein [Caldilineaceae bacterium]